MPATPYNPYAKKSKTSGSQAPANPYLANQRRKESTGTNSIGNANTNSYAVSSLPPTVAATFSQAFASLEETPHYQREMGTSSVAVDPRIAKEQTEQQALDLHEAKAAVGADAPDRDHHVLLQPHVLYASTRQRGNDVLKYIRNVPVAYSKMVPDYIMSTTTCALFLSIKYHQLYPEYIFRRIGELGKDFRLRILLVLVDVEDNATVLLRLNKLAVTNDMSLILAWSQQEAARYLESYKALDGKDASSIQKRESNNFQDQNADFMTACKPVNKTDANNLLNHFGTVQALAVASHDELALCEGLGPIKVKKLYEALHKPFSKIQSRERKRKNQQEEDQVSNVNKHCAEMDGLPSLEEDREEPKEFLNNG